MEELETFVGNHGHSSSLKKQKLIERSSEFSSSGSGESSDTGSLSSGSSEELHETKEEKIREKKLLSGQTLDADPIPQSSDAPKSDTRGFLTNVIKDRKLKTITVVIDVKGIEFNYLANEKTEVLVGANPGTLDDLLPSETIVFTSKNNSILSHVRIIAAVTKGIVTHVDNIANTLELQEAKDKKKRQPLI
jgi:hypothetical protein